MRTEASGALSTCVATGTGSLTFCWSMIVPEAGSRPRVEPRPFREHAHARPLSKTSRVPVYARSSFVGISALARSKNGSPEQ